MKETHKERVLREAAEAVEAADQADIEAERERVSRENRRAVERRWRIEAEAAIRTGWLDLITGEAAIGFMRHFGYDVDADSFALNREGKLVATEDGWAGLKELMPIVNRTWMKDFIRRDETARTANRRWTT